MSVCVDHRAVDEGLLVELYATHRARILRLCRRYLVETADAEDATQETFARLAQHLHEITGNASGYLTAMARNVCIDELRRRQARAGALLAPPEPEVDASSKAIDRWVINRALGGLSRDERSLIGLRHSGFSYDEIGERQGRSGKAVSVALMRARQKARELAGAAFSFLPLHPRALFKGATTPAQTLTSHAVIMALLVATATVSGPRGGAAPAATRAGVATSRTPLPTAANPPREGIQPADGEGASGNGPGERGAEGPLGRILPIEAPAAVSKITHQPVAQACGANCRTANRAGSFIAGSGGAAANPVGSPVVIKP